tara:strand:- start:49 stop:969 length:921 start_codon:yes stop_codon:yes gene_type:complete
MKKIITSLVLLVSLSFFGQNTFPTSGNVGIGTASPLGKLDVLLGGWNNMPRVIFNQENDHPSIRLYRPTGTATGVYSWWIENKGNQGLIFKYGFGSGAGNEVVSSKVVFANNGNVGIGTTNPLKKFHIVNNLSYEAAIFESPNSNGSNLRFIDDTNSAIEMGIQNGDAVIRTNNSIRFIAKTGSGYVGIGTRNPDEKLTVKGKIHAEEVRVDLNVPADYVFQKYYTGASLLKETYKMPTLEEVAAFTKKNHHLPEVPSAAQIQKEGLHLKQMTNLLLQKIEELTIYTIEQEKRINALESKLVGKKS